MYSAGLGLSGLKEKPALVLQSSPGSGLGLGLFGLVFELSSWLVSFDRSRKTVVALAPELVRLHYLLEAGRGDQEDLVEHHLWESAGRATALECVRAEHPDRRVDVVKNTSGRST